MRIELGIESLVEEFHRLELRKAMGVVGASKTHHPLSSLFDLRYLPLLYYINYYNIFKLEQ